MPGGDKRKCRVGETLLSALCCRPSSTGVSKERQAGFKWQPYTPILYNLIQDWQPAVQVRAGARDRCYWCKHCDEGRSYKSKLSVCQQSPLVFAPFPQGLPDMIVSCTQVVFPCNHATCKDCYHRLVGKLLEDDTVCPMCRAPLAEPVPGEPPLCTSSRPAAADGNTLTAAGCTLCTSDT